MYSRPALETMEEAKKRAEKLQKQIFEAEEELRILKEQLAQVNKAEQRSGPVSDPTAEEDGTPAWKWPLTAEEYDRYGRQLILPNVGIHGMA